jgi:hypothetical protein
MKYKVALTITSDLDSFTELACLPLDFYAVVKVLFEVSTIENAVAGRF